MQERICEEESSGGNSWEAALRWLNSSSSKPTANLTASEALVLLVIFRLLALGRIGRFDGTKVSPGLAGIELRKGLKGSEFAGAKCSLSLRSEGGIGCKAGTVADIELPKVGRFADIELPKVCACGFADDKQGLLFLE